jgi:hypothetical protein
MKYCIHFIIVLLLPSLTGQAQEQKTWKGKFEQLDQKLPTPNEYRTGAGTPGSKYWQQRADYTIDAEIDESKHTLIGRETITYYNTRPRFTHNPAHAVHHPAH